MKHIVFLLAGIVLNGMAAKQNDSSKARSSHTVYQCGSDKEAFRRCLTSVIYANLCTYFELPVPVSPEVLEAFFKKHGAGMESRLAGSALTKEAILELLAELGFDSAPVAKTAVYNAIISCATKREVAED